MIVLAATPADWPRWAFMWLLAFAVYATCKVLTWNAASTSGVPLWRECAYLFAWPGLDAAAFLHSDSSSATHPNAKEWTAALAKSLIGIMLFWTALCWISPDSPILLGWAGMVGVVLMLHFGVFHLLSCYWRSVGVDARPLMVAPLKSTSVTEFWSDRWNTAFRDFTHQFIFRPLTRRWGVKAALLIGFFFSGIVHDLVISAPAGAGYSGPTLFFIIQSLAILLERSLAGRRLGLARGWRGWVFTAIVLLVPARLLFHDPFVKEVVVPFMRALGAA